MHLGMSATEEFLVIESYHIRPTMHSGIQAETGLECSQ